MIANNLLPTTDNFTVHIGTEGNDSRLNKNIIGFTLPSITNNEISTPYLNRPGYSVSETTTLDPLTIRFVCDEEMSAYDEIYTWMNDNNNLKNGLFDFKDIIINIKTSHNNLNRQLQFVDCFPTSIGAVDFNIQGDAEPVYAVFDVNFRYDEFNFLR